MQHPAGSGYIAAFLSAILLAYPATSLLVTTDRLLSFNGRNGSWSQTRR